jgi:hypothetical protein
LGSNLKKETILKKVSNVFLENYKSFFFQIILTVSDVLRQFTGDPGLHPPDKVIRQCWNTDPYTLGSGAYPSVTTSEEDFENLTRPLPSEADPRLLFAGEATHPHYWGQVSCFHQSR